MWSDKLPASRWRGEERRYLVDEAEARRKYALPPMPVQAMDCRKQSSSMAMPVSRAALLNRDKTETPHEHVASDVGSGETTPAPAVCSPVVDHGVGRGLRDDASVRGHQHVVHIELDRSPRPHALVRVEAFLRGEGRLGRGPLLPGQACPSCPPERAGILSFNLWAVDLCL
jgi:hypothetical protein